MVVMVIPLRINAPHHCQLLYYGYERDIIEVDGTMVFGLTKADFRGDISMFKNLIFAVILISLVFIMPLFVADKMNTKKKDEDSATKSVK